MMAANSNSQTGGTLIAALKWVQRALFITLFFFLIIPVWLLGGIENLLSSNGTVEKKPAS
jgi:hypothetical protein